jgi:hypothetical protein
MEGQWKAREKQQLDMEVEDFRPIHVVLSLMRGIHAINRFISEVGCFTCSKVDLIFTIILSSSELLEEAALQKK